MYELSLPEPEPEPSARIFEFDNSDIEYQAAMAEIAGTVETLIDRLDGVKVHRFVFQKMKTLNVSEGTDVCLHRYAHYGEPGKHSDSYYQQDASLNERVVGIDIIHSSENNTTHNVDKYVMVKDDIDNISIQKHVATKVREIEIIEDATEEDLIKIADVLIALRDDPRYAGV